MPATSRCLPARSNPSLTPTTPASQPAGAITIATCASCPAPIAEVTSAAKISVPCNPAMAATLASTRFIIADGSASRDTSGRALTGATWTLTAWPGSAASPPVAASSVLTAAISAANARTTVRWVCYGHARKSLLSCICHLLRVYMWYILMCISPCIHMQHTAWACLNMQPTHVW